MSRFDWFDLIDYFRKVIVNLVQSFDSWNRILIKAINYGNTIVNNDSVAKN